MHSEEDVIVNASFRETYGLATDYWYKPTNTPIQKKLSVVVRFTQLNKN
jgi:hypothetical protein